MRCSILRVLQKNLEKRIESEPPEFSMKIRSLQVTAATPRKASLSTKFSSAEFHRTLKTAYRIDIKTQRSCVPDVGKLAFQEGVLRSVCVIQVSFCLSEIK